ncbi:M23 family metallopeptidase [Sphingomonas sp. CJ20]
MVWARRIGWGFAALLLLTVAAFASMVRVTFGPASAPPPRAPAEAQAEGGEAALVIPVAGVSPDQLADSWGDTRGDGSRAHHAIDIMAPRGTPVLAAASGKVEKQFESANGGHTLYVRTPDGGTIHYYAHLDAYRVAEGQAVRQGDVIATVGNTGSAAGGAPHLHFEIKMMRPGERWWEGTNINPYPLLARKTVRS